MMYARVAERFLVEELQPVEAAEAAPALSEFTRLSARRPRKMRTLGIGAVVLIHSVALAAYVLGDHRLAAADHHSLTVVSLAPEEQKPEIPPPPKVFVPPLPNVPPPIIPEVQVLLTPQPNAITPPPPTPHYVPAAPPTSAPTASTESEGSYYGRLLAHLNARMHYPEMAKKRHQQGTVSVHFTMDGAGNVLSVAIAKSSGSGLLDKEALDLFRRAQPLPPIPREWNRNHLDASVPIEFALH